MPDWLTESNPTLYFLLGVAAVACAALWWRNRQPKYAAAVVVSLALLAGAYLCHHLIESDREQMVRKIGEISDAVRARQLDRAFRHVSESFQVGGVNKPSFRTFAERMQQSGQVTEFVAWAYEPGPISRETKRGELTFFFKVRGSFGETPPSYFAQTVWVFDAADGQWRIQSFELFNAINDSKSPVPIPGWGR